MSQITAEFGFYPEKLSLKVGNVSIDARADFDEIIAGHKNWEGVEKEWIYAEPYTRVFGLPKTHTITHANADGLDHLRFHVWALSFFLGMRLTTTEAGFVNATPIVPHKLVDFTPRSKSLPKAVLLAEQFWIAHRHEPDRAKGFAAAVHALFFAQYPHHLQFEQFIYFYTALEACYAVLHSVRQLQRRIPHADRISWMCNELGLMTPDWALNASGAGAEVAILRNATLHEALFMGEPLGFALHGIGSNVNLTLDMQTLICRLLVALIGGGASTYVQTPVNTRQRHFLDLP